MVRVAEIINDAHSVAQEIENLKKEAVAFGEVRAGLGEEDGPRKVFEKVNWSPARSLRS